MRDARRDTSITKTAPPLNAYCKFLRPGPPSSRASPRVDERISASTVWVSEYGAPSDPAAFTYLRAYSPLHNVRAGQCYPATLVTTADHDDRVVPSHSYKYTAAMQEAQGCDKPILLRVETKTSHVYRPTDKQIAELADQWAFAVANSGMKVGAVP